MVYKPGRSRDNRASARRRRLGCSEAESVGREPQGSFGDRVPADGPCAPKRGCQRQLTGVEKFAACASMPFGGQSPRRNRASARRRRPGCSEAESVGREPRGSFGGRAPAEVRVVGLEPTRTGHKILSLACLPISTYPQELTNLRFAA